MAPGRANLHTGAGVGLSVALQADGRLVAFRHVTAAAAAGTTLTVVRCRSSGSHAQAQLCGQQMRGAGEHGACERMARQRAAYC